ncbi:MAG: CDP-archaeol synthase [Akkermansia sp.]
MSDTLQAIPKAGKWKTFQERLLSTIILISLLVGALWWNNVWGYRILVCSFCVLTAFEWGHMLRVSGKASQPRTVTLVGVMYPIALMLSMLGFKGGALLLVFFSPILMLILLFAIEMRRVIVGSRALRSVATSFLAFIYPGWMFGMVMLAFCYKTESVSAVLWVIAVTKLSDIFAYVSGVLLGGKIWKGNKMIPHISPKKTWEGFIGSLILTSIAGVWLSTVCLTSEFSWWIVLIVTIILFIVAVLGDLAGSLVKRSLAIKDSGTMIPGIGGFFDLIDSLAFTVPVALLIFFLMR